MTNSKLNISPKKWNEYNIMAEVQQVAVNELQEIKKGLNVCHSTEDYTTWEYLCCEMERINKKLNRLLVTLN